MEINEIKKAYIKLTAFAKKSLRKSLQENKADTAKYLSGYLDGLSMMYREVEVELEGSKEVFEKQIPKKPINEGHYYLCPCCRNNLGTWDSIFVYKFFMPKYCSNCGCVLDWSEVNDE